MQNNGVIYVIESRNGNLWYAGNEPLDWKYTRQLPDATRYTWERAMEQCEWLNQEPELGIRWTVRVSAK